MKLFTFLVAASQAVHGAFTWSNARFGGGGGFVPGIVFHPTAPGVAYARTDIGGVYRLNSDDSWTPITDSIADNAGWYDTTPVSISYVLQKMLTIASQAQLGCRRSGRRPAEGRRRLLCCGSVHKQLGPECRCHLQEQ